MSQQSHVRDHYLPPDPDEYRRAEPSTGRIIVIAPTRAACETIELAMELRLDTVLEREHGEEIRDLARQRVGFGIVAGTGTGKTLAIRPIAEEALQAPLKVGVVNREREATPATPTWNVVIVTTGIARRWFQDDLIDPRDTIVVDEIHQTSAELELCLALGKRIGCRFIWLSATVDPSFYARYLDSAEMLETTAFDPKLAARVEYIAKDPFGFLDERFVRRVMRERRGVAVFLPTRAQVEQAASILGRRRRNLTVAFYHGGEPIRVIRPFLEGTAKKPYVLAMTQAGQSALNVQGLDTVVISDACYNVVIDGGRNVLTRQHLSSNEILQMAGRVHGRVPDGEVYLLTDRELEFESLVPTAPAFQLAGDSERVALTAAALGIDLGELDLPVPLDLDAYETAKRELTDRGLIEDGRLTPYGRDVEAMPVDRPWGELLVHADESLVHYVAVMANIDSLHRLTRERPDLRDLVAAGSDHLTGYNVFAEAVTEYAAIGSVFGLERHQFFEGIDEWAESRGVLVKGIEDIALGMASVMRTLERPLPERLPRASTHIARSFQDLLARVMPLDLVIDGETAHGERVKLSNSSVCSAHSAVAGRLSYFADRYGTPRAAIEGTSIPHELIQNYASRGEPEIELRNRRGRPRLSLVRASRYAGFVLERRRTSIVDTFPEGLEDATRREIARRVVEGITAHPNQERVSKVVQKLEDYWHRSGGALAEVHPQQVEDRILAQLQQVSSWQNFVDTVLHLSIEDCLTSEQRVSLDSLPTTATIKGNQIPLRYEMEGTTPVVRLRFREALARRVLDRHLPILDRPIRFSVIRGKREVIQAASIEELQQRLRRLPEDRQGRRRRGRR
jgi:ATP-dependent helicase HrpA